MICWLVILGAIVAYISLIIFYEKVYKIYKFILGFFLKTSTLIKLVFKVIKFIVLNVGVIFKYSIYAILFFTFLVFIISLAEFFIIFIKNFAIGLNESFTSSTRVGKLYLVSLYIILAYALICRKEVSLKIYKCIKVLKDKYFDSRNKENVKKYKSVIFFFGVYFSICIIGLSFYHLNGNDWSKSNKGDIINIFIWATYLITPIVAIWVFSSWKVEFREQEKYKVLTDLEENLVNIEDSFVVLYNYVKFCWDYKVLKISRSRSYHNLYSDNFYYSRIFFNDNKSNDYEVNSNCIEIMVKNRSAALKNYNNFILNRFKYEYYESDLNDFELYKYQLNLLKQKLSTAATLISSDILEVKSSEIQIGAVKKWIYEFNFTKNETITIDLEEFRELSSNILREIKEIKTGLLKD